MSITSSPAQAYYIEKSLKNGWRTRLEMRPRAIDGNYTKWVQLPDDLVLNDITTSSIKDDLPIGLVESKNMKISIDMHRLLMLINDDSLDATYKNDLIDFKDYLLDPMIVTDMTSINANLKDRKVYNTWNFFIKKMDLVKSFVSVDTVSIIITAPGPSPAPVNLDDFLYIEQYLEDDYILFTGFVKAYRYLGSNSWEIVVATSALNENDYLLSQSGTVHNYDQDISYPYTAINFNEWLMEASCVQKDNIEREIFLNKTQNTLVLDLVDSGRYALEQVNYDTLNHEIYEEGGKIAQMGYNFGNGQDFVFDIYNPRLEKREFETFRSQAENINSEEYDILLTPYFLKVDTLFNLILEQTHLIWEKYCMHNEDVSTYISVGSLSKHPYYYHNFFRPLYEDNHDYVTNIDSEGIVWLNVDNEWVREDENSIDLFFISSLRDENEAGITRGGFLSNQGETSWGKSYTNAWEFLTSCAESGGVCANISFKSFQLTTGFVGDTSRYIHKGYYPQFTVTFINDNVLFTNSISDVSSPNFDLGIDTVLKTGYNLLKSTKITATGYSDSDSDEMVEASYENKFSKGSDEWNIKDIPFNTSLSAKCEFGKKNKLIFDPREYDLYRTSKEIVEDKKYYGTPLFNTRKLYFKKQTPGNLVTQWIKVHDQVNLFQNINDGFTAIDLLESLSNTFYSVFKNYLFQIKGALDPDNLPGVNAIYKSRELDPDDLVTPGNENPYFRVVESKYGLIDGSGIVATELIKLGTKDGRTNPYPWENIIPEPLSTIDTRAILYKISGTGPDILSYFNVKYFSFDKFTPSNVTKERLNNDDLEKLEEVLRTIQTRTSYQKILSIYLTETFSKSTQFLYETSFIMEDSFSGVYDFLEPGNLEFQGSQQVGNIINVSDNSIPDDIADFYNISESRNYILLSTECDFNSCTVKNSYFVYGT